MAKAVKTIGVIAGAVALAATGVGAFAAAGTALAATASSVATIATVVSGVANIGAQALTKPPPARGSVTQILIDPNAPQPYVMGEGYFAGVLRHDTGYGPTLKKVPNPYRFMPVVYSGGGPVEGISPRTDFAAVSSWYSGFLYTDTQLGACPEADALSPQWSGAPGWSSSSRLSGQAAIGWSLKFDKNGKRFAGGLPVMGAYGQWVKVYDPRLDSTFPGGSGSHRIGDETTYEYSANPALHAGTYAYGRYQNGKRVMGMGLAADAIDWAVIAAWANVCEANGWENFFGVVYEPGDRWANLKDICFAGGADPVALGQLTFRYRAPTVALDTITEADLTDDDQSVMAMQSFRDRINTGIPKYRSPAHNWEMVDAEPVVNSTFLTEDGEEKRETWPCNFVTDEDQASQLVAYHIWDSRELAPITLVCKPRMRSYRPGECLHLDLPELGLDTTAIILRRELDPATMKVKLELMGETSAKHAYCLGLTGTAPPTPAIGQTAQEKDELASAASDPAGLGTLKLSSSYTRGLAGNITQLHDGTGTGTVTVTIPDHTRVYADGTEASVTGGDFTLDETTSYLLSYDDPDFAGGELGVDFALVEITPGTGGQTGGDAYFSAANPSRHYLASISTVNEAGEGGGAGGSSPPGGGGWDNDDPGGDIP
tara:strand:+ start:1790 stop:3757 length:1968 start_codon:yes stop_codon:yes gene_type:complete